MAVAKPNSIAIYVCTYQRNDPLRTLISSVRVAAKRVQPETSVALVVVDDNADGRAQSVVETENHGFDDGLHYRFSGAGNISVARNIGIDACLELADWVAMVDDDQVATEGWLESLIRTQQKNDSDAVTGPVYLRYADHCPSWLHSEPFGEILEAPTQEEGQQVAVCSTGNSMISSEFLKANPDIRFRDELGKVGGEDMVFYRAAVEAGLRAHYSIDAVCWGEQPAERSNLKYQLRASMWMGNSEYLTNIESGSTTRSRMVLRAGRRLTRYMGRAAKRLFSGRSPQLRFVLAGFAQVLGILAGAVGIRIQHI